MIAALRLDALSHSLADGGSILLANFVPDHLAVGWMEAVMDWHLEYRDEAALAAFARAIGLRPRTWQDSFGVIAFCEMFADATRDEETGQ